MKSGGELNQDPGQGCINLTQMAESQTTWFFFCVENLFLPQTIIQLHLSSQAWFISCRKSWHNYQNNYAVAKALVRSLGLENPIACYSGTLQSTPPDYYGGVALQRPPNTDTSLETPSEHAAPPAYL